MEEAQENAERTPRSNACYVRFPRVPTDRDLQDELRGCMQRAIHHWNSRAEHLDCQERREYWTRFKRDVISLILAMDLEDDLVTVSEPRHRSVPSLHLEPPNSMDLRAHSMDALEKDVPQSNREPGASSDRADDVREKPPKTGLQLPAPGHRKQSSISSNGTGHYSAVSDRALESQESPPPLRLFACIPGQRPIGARLHGPLDTGHTAPAPLLREGILRSRGWRPYLRDPPDEEDTLTVVNGTTIQKLGQIDLEVDFVDDDDKPYLKKRITWHVVPDGSIRTDCLINWKLYLKFARLRAHFQDKTRSISDSLRGISRADELRVPRL